jgi:3-oxoadipate enol-lactonase
VQTRRVQVGAIGLEVVEAGAGGRPLLLVHGFTGAKEDFAHALDDLAALGWHGVAPDLRGHGGSDQPADEGAYGFDSMAADLAGLMDALGWERAVVVGHSMGGMVVQELALAWPERVEALVFMGTSPGAPEGYDLDLVPIAVQVAREQGMAALNVLMRELADADPLASPAFKRLCAERPGYQEYCDKKFLACSPAMFASMATKFFSHPDRLPRLATVSVPTLVIAGHLDRAFLEPCRRLAAAIPGARLVEIPDAGHSPQFETPDVWWAELTAFLDEVAAEVPA